MGNTANNLERPQAKGYSEAGGSVTKRSLKGFNPRSGSAREDIDFNNRTLRERGRILYMSAPIATAAINTNRTKVVGTGLTLKCSVDRDILGISAESAKAWQKKTEAEFELWAGRKDACDATGVNNFLGMQQLALKSWLTSGDMFALIKKHEVTPLNPYSLRLHLVEADRVSTPSDCLGYGGVRPLFTTGVNPANNNKVYDGVEVDNGGKIVAYHVSNHYPNERLVEPMKWVRVTAYGAKTGLPNILHIMDTERCEQYRGVTYLAPVIEMLLQLRQYTESELTAALIQTFFVAFIITETNPTGIPVNEVGAGDYDGLPAEEAENISHSENEYEMGPGEVMHLKPGEKVEFGNPNVPTVGFDTFVKAISRLIGAGLEIPYEVLTKEFTKSYSASRGALLEAWEAFKMRRAWFIDDFCQPTYELWLAEAIARGRINAPGFFDDPRIRAAWCGTQWIGPTQGQLDPLKEAKAATLLVDRGFKTHEQVTREMGGGDWDNNVDALKIENEKLRDAGAASVTMVEVEKEESEETGREE